MKKLNQNGSHLVAGVIVIVVLTVAGLAGGFIAKKPKTVDLVIHNQ
jgi:uncharacterized membrane protein SpoIIM required for sporulation